MFKVLNKLYIGNLCCVSVEGDVKLLKNGLKLSDGKNIFEIKTVAMVSYYNVKDYEKYADVVLYGDVENIGGVLFLDN